MRYAEIFEDISGEELLSKILTPELKNLQNIFNMHGFEIRLVGGVVRDLILNQEPKDIDLATDARPEQMLEILERRGIRTILTGEEHGTITAVINKNQYEITTLRIDTETTGRHATVEYTKSWKKDAKRRDLTFNAMSLSFDGQLYDYFGGKKDLETQTVKFVGNPNDRIKEDYLRILRYFRFHGRYNKNNTHAADIETAITKNADMLNPKQGIISGERIWLEMSKILIGNNVGNLLKKMSELGVSLNINLPALNFRQADTVAKLTTYPITVLATILEIEKHVTTIIKNWKLSNYDSNLLKFLVQNKNKTLTKEDIQGNIVDGVSRKYLRELSYVIRKPELAEYAVTWELNNVPIFPVNGNDLMDFGIRQGPKLGEWLKFLRNEWKKSRFTLTKNDLIRKVK